MIDVSQPGICRGCGTRVYWCEERSGRRNPYDRPEECPECQGAGCDVSLRTCVVCAGEGRIQTSHFATCPEAARFRRLRGGTAR